MTDTTKPARKSWLQRLYDWILHHAKGPYAWELMGAISFAESSFLPIAPDFILIPMVLADRKQWWKLALWCTVTSVVGGWLGYYIGYSLQPFAHWLLGLYGEEGGLAKFQQLYREYGDWIILIKGATPIPYKIVTIASGLAHYDFWRFTMLSVITRGVRFFLWSGLLYWFGEPIKNFIEKHLGLTLLLIVAVLAAGLLMARYLF